MFIICSYKIIQVKSIVGKHIACMVRGGTALFATLIFFNVSKQIFYFIQERLSVVSLFFLRSRNKNEQIGAECFRIYLKVFQDEPVVMSEVKSFPPNWLTSVFKLVQQVCQTREYVLVQLSNYIFNGIIQR